MREIRLLVLDKPTEPHLRLLERLPDSVHVEAGLDDKFIRSHAPQAEVILIANSLAEPFRTAWPLAKRVKWVHSLWAGVEDFVIPEFVASPVPLTNARGVFKRSLAEFVMTAILYFAKDIPRMLRQQKASFWEKFEVEEAYGHTLGVVGYGEIGRASAALAHNFGMNSVALRRRADISAGEYPPDRIREMLSQCDYVVVSAPITAETRGMIGEAELQSMKKSSVLINIGRGPVVHEASLILALKEGWIRGAALDVYDEEPLPHGHPFWKMENVLLSPHCADRTPGWLEQSTEVFLRNFGHYIKGEELENVVDKKASY